MVELDLDKGISQVLTHAVEFKRKTFHEFIVFPKEIKEKIVIPVIDPDEEEAKRKKWKYKPWISSLVAPWDKLPQSKEKEIRETPVIKKQEAEDCHGYWTRSRQEENDPDVPTTFLRTSEQSVLTEMLPLKKWAKKVKLPDWGRDPLEEIEYTCEPHSSHRITSPMVRHFRG